MARRVLILMSDTGGGHRSAAEAIAEGLEHIGPGEFEVQLLDFIADCTPFPLNRAGRLYRPAVTYSGPLWGWFWRLNDGQHEPVGTGDEINTDDNGLGILTFADFLRVEVFRQTGLQVKAAPDPDAPPIVKLYLALGTTLQELQERAGERVIVTTETDWATIESTSTKYLVSVDEDKVTSVFVYEGEAEVEAQQQTVTVGPGQATLVEPRKAPRLPMDAEMGAVDNWVSGARQAEEVGSIKPVVFPRRGRSPVRLQSLGTR